MSRGSRRQLYSGAALLGFLAVPFAYNACGAMGKSASFASSACANLSAIGTDGENVVLNLKRAVPPVNVFARSKVLLNSANAAASKTAVQTHAAGTELAVIVDTKCLRANAATIETSAALISRAARADPNLRDDLDQQSTVWRLPSDLTTEQITAQAASEPCVVGLSENATYRINAFATDPLYGMQTYAAVDNAEAAFNAVFGGGGLARTGSSVVVAVIDSGADLNHPDLIGHLWPGPNGHGFDVPGNGNVPSEVSVEGHGTHVAGMIAAVANNGVGIAGLMPYRVQVMPIKIFTSDANGNLSSSSTYVYNAIRLAIANGASVINMSIGSVQNGTQSDALTLQGINEAVAAGVTVVTVIGNAATSNGQGTFIDGSTWSVIPGQFATIKGVIGVGSINVSDGAKSTFSNYSSVYAEIAAPGAQAGTSGVLSTVPTSMGSYGYLAGTSQAAPQVSAAAAMAIAIIQSAYGTKPSAAEVENLIKRSALKQPTLAPYFTQGNRLDMGCLVSYIKAKYPRVLSGAGN